MIYDIYIAKSILMKLMFYNLYKVSPDQLCVRGCFGSCWPTWPEPLPSGTVPFSDLAPWACGGKPIAMGVPPEWLVYKGETH